jgi:hypothetical protein
MLILQSGVDLPGLGVRPFAWNSIALLVLELSCDMVLFVPDGSSFVGRGTEKGRLDHEGKCNME